VALKKDEQDDRTVAKPRSRLLAIGSLADFLWATNTAQEASEALQNRRKWMGASTSADVRACGAEELGFEVLADSNFSTEGLVVSRTQSGVCGTHGLTLRLLVRNHFAAG
jgi:hypothetical protein